VWIKNVARGTPFSPDVADGYNYLKACKTQLLNYTEWDVIGINARLGSFQMTCTPDRVVLRDGVGRARCSVEENDIRIASSDVQFFYDSEVLMLSKNREEMIEYKQRLEKDLAEWRSVPTTVGAVLKTPADVIARSDTIKALEHEIKEINKKIMNDSQISQVAQNIANLRNSNAMTEIEGYALASPSNYLSPLQIDLNYMYVQTDSQKLEINRIY